MNSKTKDADKDRCRYCREIGHWERDCPQKKGDQSKTEDPKPYGAFSGLSDTLPEFYGQGAPLQAITESFHGITEVLREDTEGPGEKHPEQAYLNW